MPSTLTAAQIQANNAALLANEAKQATMLSSVSLLPFTGAQSGIQLPSIVGYPPDLPSLQLSADGRLCFWNWPKTFSSNVWFDAKTQAPLAEPLSSLDYVGTYLRLFFFKPSTKAEYDATKASFDAGLIPFNYAYYGTSGIHKGYWLALRPVDMIFTNVQYYIQRYLKNPYSVTELIPYGTNWVDQFKASMMEGTSKFVTYLSGCSFLVQPVGTKGFWDKFYLVAPLIITTIAGIMTAGAATPALAIAIAALTVKTGEAKAAQASLTQLPQQGTPIVNATNVTTDVASISASSLTKTPIYIIGIVLILLIIFWRKLK